MFVQNVLQQDVATGNRRRHHISAGFNPVGNHGVSRAGEVLHAFDPDRVCSGASHIGAHRIQIVGQVYDLRLLGCVFNDCPSIGQTGSHHDIFGGADAGKVKIDFCALQPFGRPRFNKAMPLNDFGAERFESFQMQINRPGADGATARLRYPRLLESRQQRPHNQKRGPHLPDQFIRGLAAFDACAVNKQAAWLATRIETEVLQYLGDGRDIVQIRDFFNNRRGGCKQRGGNDRQHSILCATDLDGPRKSASPLNE